MTKYNSLFKQQVIEFYLQQHKNRSFTRQYFHFNKRTLNRWIGQFNHYGFPGLAVRGKKQAYSPEFKLSVVQAVINGQFSAESACLHFGIANSGIISQWLQAFEKQGINGLLPKPKGRPVMKSKSPKMPRFKTEEERLRYRILELEAEVAVLKKLQELNQQKMAEKPKSSTR
ncbi:hypothetical protein A4G19_05945 [Pasteurellaceae bacterium Macca]|nr:hypothetical protein [Pasteurellaceae bacterium Macca]